MSLISVHAVLLSHSSAERKSVFDLSESIKVGVPTVSYCHVLTNRAGRSLLRAEASFAHVWAAQHHLLDRGPIDNQVSWFRVRTTFSVDLTSPFMLGLIVVSDPR
jgi:hypothetical protein